MKSIQVSEFGDPGELKRVEVPDPTAGDGQVVVNVSRGAIEVNPRETTSRDSDIRGMTLFNVNDAYYSAVHVALVVGLANRTLVPMIGWEMRLPQAAAAHEAVMADEAHGKFTLLP